MIIWKKQTNDPQSCHTKTAISKRYLMSEEDTSLSGSVRKEQETLKRQKEKIKQLSIKLTKLEESDYLNNKKGVMLQQKCLQMQRNCAILQFHINEKSGYLQRKQSQFLRRKKAYSEFKSNCKDSHNKATEKFESQRQIKLKKIRDEESFYSSVRRSQSHEEFEIKKMKVIQMKEKEKLGKQRLKRYEQFKLKQAKSNREDKKKKFFQSFQQKAHQLSQLKSQAIKKTESIQKLNLLKSSSYQSHFSLTNK